MFEIELTQLIETGGVLLVAAIVFAESGLLIGFFLPGDTLLFSAGFLAGQGYMNLGILVGAVIAAAIIGDNVGYTIGRRAGPRIFRYEEGLFFHKDHIRRAQQFYEAHGGKTIILARFIPIVRTFAPIVAGIGSMPRERFVFYNIAGGVLWGSSVTLVGFWAQRVLGQFIDIERYILPIIASVIAGSLLAAFWHLLRDEQRRQELVKRTIKRRRKLEDREENHR